MEGMEEHDILSPLFLITIHSRSGAPRVSRRVQRA
jgi:hypothetical protein